MEEPTYINGIWVQEFNKNPDYPPIFNVTVNVQQFTDQLAPHMDAKGKVRLKITKRKQPGKYGETHCVKLDTWKPKVNDDGAP